MTDDLEMQEERCPFCGSRRGHTQECLLGMAVKWDLEPPRIKTHELTLREIAKLQGKPGLITSHGHVVAVLVPVSNEEEAERVKARLQNQDHS